MHLLLHHNGFAARGVGANSSSSPKQSKWLLCGKHTEYFITGKAVRRIIPVQAVHTSTP